MGYSPHVRGVAVLYRAHQQWLVQGGLLDCGAGIRGIIVAHKEYGCVIQGTSAVAGTRRVLDYCGVGIRGIIIPT